MKILDVAYANVCPCTGCVTCSYEGPCVQKGSMETLRKRILDADMLIFATPLYYHGITVQFKMAVDRFCAFSSSLHAKHMASALIVDAWNSSDWIFDGLNAHYKTLVRYLNFQDKGETLGYGCGAPGMTKRSRYVKQAREFGRNLK